MSDPENFVVRWSRRKRAADEDRDATKPALPAGVPASEGEAPPRDAAATPDPAAEPPFDLAQLPPLESITAESDIRAFLAPGVPPDLTRAALRRAWTSDPKIRDFVGLADYAWDYHTPGSMAGFGPLEMTDDLRRLVARVFGADTADDAAARPNPIPAIAPAPQTSTESDHRVASTAGAATGHDETPQDEPAKLNRQTLSPSDLAPSGKVDIAAQQKLDRPNDLRTIDTRPHGRALPK
jgi:hypothetical protein